MEDEAAWITARVRVGELAPVRLAVAALCGHEAARLARGEPARNVEETARHFGVEPGTLRRWAKRGCPATRTGTSLAFDLASVLHWREDPARTDAQAARRRRALFLRVLAVVDHEAAGVAERLAGATGAPTDDVIRHALVKWALALRVVCRPAVPGRSRFSVERVELGRMGFGELPAVIEHRLVETATGRVVLKFEETPDYNLDPEHASLGMEDDGVNVIAVFTGTSVCSRSVWTFEYVVLPTKT